MTTQEYIDNIKQVFDDCLEIVRSKNADYAEANDPFKNFRNSEMAGVKLERGILVRIMDKMSRVSNLLDKAPAVKDEKIEDTIKDAINYLAILLTYIQNDQSRLYS